jgi:hypothetical protein
MYFIDIYENEQIFMHNHTYQYLAYVITVAFSFFVINSILYIYF